MSSWLRESKSLLKAYFPAILLMKPAQIYADFVVRLLLKYPTLGDVQAAGPTKLRKLFFGLGAKDKDRISDRCADECQAAYYRRRIVTDQHSPGSGNLSPTHCTSTQPSTTTMNRSKSWSSNIQTIQSCSHFPVERKPRLASSRRSVMIELDSGLPNEFSAATGIAPITTQSGKSRYVSSRWACTKFLKQTFHEFAGLSIRKSRWAKCYYDQQIVCGKSPQMACRALAFKWIRIIYRCWQTSESYDETRYTNRLIATQSPLAAKLVA